MCRTARLKQLLGTRDMRAHERQVGDALRDRSLTVLGCAATVGEAECNSGSPVMSPDDGGLDGVCCGGLLAGAGLP